MTVDPQFALQASGVCFHYPDGVAALDAIDLALPRGQFAAVLGANGSGKTTLLKVLLRLLQPQEGRVLFGGVDIRELKAAQLYRQVGMVFQNPCDQLFAATVEQDVAFGPRNLGLPEPEVRSRVEEALAAVDALSLRDRPIHHLSFGEQKRVCVAGALAMAPAVLLLDEPTAGLDPQAELQMIELLTRLNRERGITILLATHAVDLLPVLADRVLVLCRGRLAREGTPREIFGDAESARAAGLRLPLISQLFVDLAGAGAPVDPLPLTVAEAKAALMRMSNDE